MSIAFELDFISPYAYLAWHAAQPIAARHGRRIEPVPVLFAGILNAHGQLGPAEIPAKRIYTFKDALRKARALGLPLVPPPGHPFNPLLALRVATLDLQPEVRHALITDLFAAAWSTGQGVTDPEVVGSIAASHGIDDAVVRASDPAIKARVRTNTEAAIARGTFGVPSLWVDGELFWGTDSLSHLDRFLAGEDPLPADLLERWAHIRPQATRR